MRSRSIVCRAGLLGALELGCAMRLAWATQWVRPYTAMILRGYKPDNIATQGAVHDTVVRLCDS